MWRPAIVMTALVLLAACGAEPGSAARPSDNPTSAPTRSATSGQDTPPPQPQMDRCHTSGLSLSVVTRAEGGAGNFNQVLGLTNKSGSACWVYGYVGMALLDAGGKQLPTRVVRDTGARFPFAHVGQYTLKPDATAPFWMHWGQVPVGSETSCPMASGLILTPPDETTQLRLTGIQIMACNGGQIDVSPVMPPGTSGP